VGEISNCVFYANTRATIATATDTNSGAAALKPLSYAKGNSSQDRVLSVPRARLWTAAGTWDRRAC